MSLPEMIKKHSIIVEPKPGPEVLPPEETALLAPPPPGYHSVRLPVDYGMHLVAMGLAFLPGTEPKLPAIIEAQKPRLTEGE